MTNPLFCLSPLPLHTLRLRGDRQKTTVCSQLSPSSKPSPLSQLQHLPPIFFVLGGPGSGKGTQCNFLKRDYDVQQICVGDLLRREATSGTPLGNTVADIMQRGEIVPGHVTMSLLKEELALLAGLCNGVLIDGFPRAMDQANDFEQMVATCEFVLYFRCAKEVMVERLLRRGKTSGRADDVDEVVSKRLHTFENKTMPVVEHFRKRGLLREIDSSFGTPEQIYERTHRFFKEAFR